MGNGSIGLAVSTQNNPFFVTLVEGAADKLSVDLQVTDAGDDAAKQTTDIETLVASGISVLIVNPVDSDAVAGAVKAAIAKGVRVISVDRAVNGVEIDCSIASDNVAGAAMATQFIVDTLAGLLDGMPVPEILKMSAKAPSIAVSRAGAVPSIPYRSEVTEDLAQ